MNATVDFSDLINPKPADKLFVLVASADYLNVRTTKKTLVETYMHNGRVAKSFGRITHSYAGSHFST